MVADTCHVTALRATVVSRLGLGQLKLPPSPTAKVAQVSNFLPLISPRSILADILNLSLISARLYPVAMKPTKNQLRRAKKKAQKIEVIVLNPDP